MKPVDDAPLRVGLIGVGSVVREIYRHLYYHSGYAPLLSIVGAADPNRDALDAFCDQYGIPAERRFTDHAALLDSADLDAVQVNTPDALHRGPTLAALARGLDVVVPKPLASSITDAHAMRSAALAQGRLVGVDFHKRDDPRIREAATQYQAGVYGGFQCAVWYMLDKLLVADPNHQPRFFASPNFAVDNSPISFLTVHMVDAFLQIVRLKPVSVRCIGFAQKLPTLAPVAVAGYDLCDTEVTFENGGVARIITGWHLPNTAHALTVQSGRIICTDGLLDLALDATGFREITAEGLTERNPLFRNFEADGRVTGYGMSHPGRLYENILRHRRGQLTAEEYAELMSPLMTGFHATVVCAAAERSLAEGVRRATGAVHGREMDLADLVRRELGAEAGAYL